MKKRLAVLLSAVLALTMFGGQFTFAASGDQFEDVDAGAWYKADVDYVAENGYMIGTSDTTFEPQSNLTRAMFATILARYDGAEVDNSKATIFTDVEVGQWFTGSIGWANEKEIVNGIGDNKFAPDKYITRQDLAVMVERYIAYVESTTELVHVTPGKAIPFTDADQISDYAKDAMDKAVIHGLIIGYPDKSVKPRQNITRAETAAVIHRIKWQTSDGKEEHVVTGVDSVNNKELSQDTVKTGNTYTVPEGPEKAGYTFKEWNTKKDGTGTSYNPGDKILLTEDLTLYAIYTKNSSGGGGGGSTVTKDKYVVTAALTGPKTLNAKWPIELTKTYEVSSNGTGDKTIDVVMKDLVTGDNETLLNNGIQALLDDLESAHNKTVDVNGSTYVVNLDPNTKEVTATKDGVAVNDWDTQLKAEQDLYIQRMSEFATAAKVSEAGATSEWNAFVAALSPENLIDASAKTSMKFKEQADYLKAAQDAAINAGVVLKKLGDKGFTASYEALVEYMASAPLSIDLSGYTVDNTELTSTTDATSGKFDAALKNKNGILLTLTDKGKNEYVALLAKESVTQEDLLKTIDQRTSRAWKDQPAGSEAIVAFIKANQQDGDSKFFGDYELKVTVKKK